MGNVPSALEEPRSPCRPRRRLSKHQAVINWVQVVGENDYHVHDAPTTPRSGAGYRGLDEAIPTVPSLASMQGQGPSRIHEPPNKGNLTLARGQHLSAATGGHKSRPSRHSTDAFHPLRSAPVSGSARAASMKEGDAPGNDVEKNKLDEQSFSSPPDLSSSSSTESGRTLSSDSDASRESPHYIPYRRRSLQQIPGLATRPGKEEIRRRNLPTSPPHHPYSPPDQAKDRGDPASSLTTTTPTPVLVLNDDANDLGNASEVDYRQLGSIKFGSLRITNGSPLSMRRGEETSADQLVDLDGDMNVNQGSSSDATNAHLILPSEPPPIKHFSPANSNWSPEKPLNNMHVSEAVRGRQGRMSSDTPRPSVETIRNRISSVIEVIGDEQLNLVRRPRSTLVTTDDSSSIYSDNLIPVMISDDIAAEQNYIHTDNSNGPHLSFQSFRDLIRQNRVKSYLQANNKAAIISKPSHSRSASKEDASSIASVAMSPVKSRRKLAKKNHGPAPPSAPLLSSANTHDPQTAQHRPRTSSGYIAGEPRKRHVGSHSDSQVPRMRSSSLEKVAVPRTHRQPEPILRNRQESYQTTTEHVPILLDRARATSRPHVNFEGDLPKQKYRPARVEQLRRSQTAQFKPLPTPKPELPQRRKPVRVSAPPPIVFGTQVSQESPVEGRSTQSLYPPMPSQVQSDRMPLEGRQYMRTRAADDDTPKLRLFFPDNDSPYVSPLSDDGEDFWPLDADFQPREVSPIRQAKSLSNIRSGGDDDERETRSPAPPLVNTPSRRAQELAERWQQQQQQSKQVQQQSRRPSLEPQQTRPPAFDEQASTDRPTTASAIDEYYGSPLLLVKRDSSLPPMVYRNGTRRGAEISSAVWRPPYRVLHSYYSPAYSNAPIWG
ncbi:hypothetical protein ISF_01225 [Cordyceps fumosorosea ARSEF 2679]|uniref:Uncharacterized protein n=1 Tax=Cordyceps fumosorosea (strain ARSEF 2679) TaxID=1081104 RepID=A0A162JQ72_CORFA|nr:hypothetical protein ISF_01225 [Cordyceps fumosorosea ARSEF 2679]OAA72152.1 hypothetical protein ISF_01225 [Cordyceps fumosorosea ARSEF 2679]